MHVRLSRQSRGTGNLFKNDDDAVPDYGSRGDLENVGGDGKYSKTIVCPDGNVIFKLTAKKTGNPNFFKGKFFD